MLRYAVIFVLAALISIIFTPVARRIAYRFGAIDIPDDERRIHNKPIPRMGGLAIYISFVICSLIFSKFNTHVVGIIAGGTILVIAGMIDDVKPLRPVQKLIFQIAASAVLIAFGITIGSITVPFIADGESVYIGYFGIPLTILWVVGITNAVNLIDGLDGLAAGLAMIFSITIFVVSMISNREVAMLLTAILAGSCLGFLPYNFNPASIFMGDTGSQFLGFTLAAISTQGAVKSAAAVTLAVPILVLWLPIFDTLFAMVRRKVNKRPIMEADRGHLHHRLLDLGLSHRKVVIIMYLISIFLGATAVLAMVLSTQKSYVILLLVCFITLSIGVEFGFITRKTRN
ncbi:glycosyltransferase family 4 protein [Fonticella tunisiensis]|uniref:UDP-GlcNAc:undecaprenyl-phosphate GlcNAc-1-phosphate transferase n=1 Tax=Fonticella tunisiensis TaxID=1096341 RepID=A0A4R7KS03_9CLOT|nr:MraY family glycosyltransferase [Fonticella tunisiensis]TDT62385.1 UDP-GlcNAc:undecaprenyl-phosphate GlcNAc-1-phosphate transferase [Fonticella tunisiensis]